MPENISNRLVNSIELKNKPYEIRDTQLRGLILRVQPSGVLNYYLQYGRGKRIKLGDGAAITPIQARELARNALSEVYQGDDPVKKRQQPKVENYLHFLESIYKPWLEVNLRTGAETFSCLKQCFPELHRLQLNEITPPVIEKWRLRRKGEGLKPASINRQLADLKSCLNRAIEDWGLLKENPIIKVKLEKKDKNAKVRYLTEGEESKLYAALDEREQSIKEGRDKANEWRTERGYPLYSDLKKSTYVDYLKPCILLSLNTGLRRNELFNLKWADVDIDRKVITVNAETAKGGTTRHIPLNQEALTVLKLWKRQEGLKSLLLIDGTKYIFPNEDEQPFHDVRTSWGNVLRKAKIHNFRWHDLRHSFASKLVMAGVDLNTVRELLGHSDYKMTLRYAHLAPEHKAAAVAKLVAVK